MLTHPPVLAYPNFDLPFVLHTGASEDLGLFSTNSRAERCKYGSRTLNPAERNYHLHSGKLEFLALKWAECCITVCIPDDIRWTVEKPLATPPRVEPATPWGWNIVSAGNRTERTVSPAFQVSVRRLIVLILGLHENHTAMVINRPF